MGKAMVEFPAGKLDEGEHSLACAQRELQEETGYTAREWAHAGVMHPVISYSTEHIDVWFARGLTLGERRLDDGEFLDVFAATQTELMEWARQGLVTDAKTLVGLLWLQNVASGVWPLCWRGADDAGHVCPSGPFVPSVPAWAGATDEQEAPQ
jgi:ADP-ribose pyrophosphatase